MGLTILEIQGWYLCKMNIKGLRAQQHLLKMVDEIEGCAIILLDDSGNMETWNKGVERIKGYKAEEVIGENF